MALTDILKSDRCQTSKHIAQLANHPLQLCLRQWHKLDNGKQYRCVIFEGKLKKIVPNQLRIDILTASELLQRCQRLVDRCQYDFPCIDNVMDVWIADQNSVDDDLMIEFNSFGIVGNSHSDDIDWRDPTLYLDNMCQVIINDRIDRI